MKDFPICTVAMDYMTPPVAGREGPDATGCAETDRELEIVVRAIGDGDWLLVGPWNTPSVQKDLGFEILEELSLADVILETRGEKIAIPLLEKHRKDFEVGIHACQNFCVFKPGSTQI